jgi:hypothetical protein
MKWSPRALIILIRDYEFLYNQFGKMTTISVFLTIMVVDLCAIHKQPLMKCNGGFKHILS